MATGPQCPLLRVAGIILRDVLLDGRRSELNSFPYVLLASDLRSPVHGQDHSVACIVAVYLRHPGAHNMHSTEYNGAFHLSSLQATKDLVHGVGFDSTLVRQKVSRAPLWDETSHYLESSDHDGAVFTVYEEVSANTPRPHIVANIESEKPPVPLVGLVR